MKIVGKPNFYSMSKVRADAGSVLGRIEIFDEIDSVGVTGKETTPRNFATKLHSLGEVSRLEIYICSPGGDVGSGSAIYSLLRQYSKPIDVYIMGICGSIATLVPCAADKVYIAESAQMYFHNPYMPNPGSVNRQKAIELAENLQKYEEPMIAAYMKKTGRTREEIISLMDGENGNGTLLTAEESIAWGFADDYIPDAKKQLEVAACIAPGKYKYKGHIINFSHQNERKQNMSILNFGKKKTVSGKPSARNALTLPEYKCWNCQKGFYLNEETEEVMAAPAYDEKEDEKIQAYVKHGRAKAKIYLCECPHCHALNEINSEVQSDGDSGEPIIDTREDEAEVEIELEDEDVAALIHVTHCPECDTLVEYDTETALQTESGFELTCHECGTVFIEPFEMSEEVYDQLKAAYKQGIRAERKRVSELSEIAAKAPGMSTAIHAAIRNGNKPDAVRKRVISNMGSGAPVQNPKAVKYMAGLKRGTALINGMPSPVAYGAYRAQASQKTKEREQQLFNEEMARAQGRTSNHGDNQLAQVLAGIQTMVNSGKGN